VIFRRAGEQLLTLMYAQVRGGNHDTAWGSMFTRDATKIAFDRHKSRGCTWLAVGTRSAMSKGMRKLGMALASATAAAMTAAVVGVLVARAFTWLV
jgi:hypothetical protein